VKKAGKDIIKSALWVFATVLTLCIIATGIILGGRLERFLSTKEKNVIELTPNLIEKSDTTQTVERVSSEAAKTTYRQTYFPGFEVEDDKGIWESNTEIEIFKINYKNETGDITVDGMDDKVVAPGTSNTYDFTVKNTGNIPIDYTLSAKVIFSDSELVIPINARFKNYSGKYLVGNEVTLEHISKLDGVTEKATMPQKTNGIYTLEWEWPFETGDDIYDTLLGDTAVDKDIRVTVVINTYAEAEIPETPDTGDGGITLFIIIAAVSFAAIIILLILKKKGEKTDGESYAQEQ